jgi:hypothetical protein
MGTKIRGNSINSERHPYDFYPTDPKWTRALQRHVDLGPAIWEPAAGEGHMSQVLSAGIVVATDITHEPSVDFLGPDASWFADGLPYGVSIVTNPPYKHFDQFVTRALDLTSGVVAMLGSLQALGGINRTSEVWTKAPPSLVLVIPQRMVVNGAPSQFCHAWYVWRSEHPVTTLVWDELKEG